jgi:ribosomal subunit interface protein
MKITLKKSLDTTPALETYIETKLQPLEKFLKHFEENGECELHLEVARTTNHHNKGEEVYAATGNLQLGGTILRSEASASDIHRAIDEVRNILHMEIEKYKEKNLVSINHPQREEK